MKWRCSVQAEGVEGVKVLPLLGGFACKVYIHHLSKILLEEACFFSFLPLAAILESNQYHSL
jgi:hypothetical protein